MAPEFQAVVYATQAWLRSSWHIQVPFAWLEACVEWLQEEAGGAGHLSQQQINQQVLDQWLLADLRDLDYPVLPEGLAQAQKTELNGTFCVQVDSLLDISQPAYGQLQKLRGTDCENDEVSAVTQATQRTWEAKPTRMLLLQVTDGVQSLEAMEYQSIPALSTALRPGVKLQLQGQMVCRLGMLLLGPSNVKVLGGEVEDLVDRNKQERVLCQTLGVPEEEQQQQQAGEEDPPAPQQGDHYVDDLELDDAELVASLDAQEVVERIGDEPAEDSGYGTRIEPSTQSSRSSSIRSLVSAAPARSETFAHSYRRGLTQTNNRDGSVQGCRHSYEQEHCNVLPSVLLNEQDHHMEGEDFLDEDFDNLPLDELDAAIFQESTNGADIGHNSAPNESTALKPSRATKPLTAQFEQNSVTASGSWISSRNCRSSTQKTDYEGFSTGVTGQLAAGTYPMDFAANAGMDFVDEDMDCLLINEQTGESNQLPAQQGLHTDRQCITKKTEISSSSCAITSESSRSVSYTTSTPGFNRPVANARPQSQSSVPALTLTSPPYTYLCLLEQMASSPDFQTTEIHLKAFIVTLLGKLSSSNNLWHVTATISDGTGYLDVELSNDVLTSLLGFSVAEKGVLKRDSARRRELDAGMKRCQEELVDMCCIMTIVVEAEGRKAVVTKAEAVSEEVLQELEQRMKAVRK